MKETDPMKVNLSHTILYGNSRSNERVAVSSFLFQKQKKKYQTVFKMKKHSLIEKDGKYTLNI